MITKSQYVDWKSSPVTQELMQNIVEAVEENVAILVRRRSSEPLDDQYIKGYVRGVQAAIEWEPELVEES